MSEYVPTFNFETLPDGTLRVMDNSIQDAVLDLVKRMTDAKETALKEAIKSLGWIAPEDIAARDARIASEAAERALREAADDLRIESENAEPEKPSAYREGVVAGLLQAEDIARTRADRIRAEREEGDE